MAYGFWIKQVIRDAARGDLSLSALIARYEADAKTARDRQYLTIIGRGRMAKAVPTQAGIDYLKEGRK